MPALSGNLAVHDGALWLQVAGAPDAKVMDLPIPTADWPLVEEYGGTGWWSFGTLIADNPVQRQLFVSTSGSVPATALAWSVDDYRSGNHCHGSGRYRLVDFK